MTKDQIRAVFLANGFTIKEGETDLKPYVYEAASALLALASPQVAPTDVISDALDAFERRERGTVQAHIAAKLVAELRAALAAPVQVALTPDEQSAFETWLEETCPSGDHEAVQRQWQSSSAYRDFCGLDAPVQVASTLAPAAPDGARADAPVEMCLCETRRIVPLPGRTYVFVEAPDCPACKAIADAQQDSYGARSPAPQEVEHEAEADPAEVAEVFRRIFPAEPVAPGRRETKKVLPGDELHLTILGVPYGFNFLTGKDRQDALAYGRDVWGAALTHAAQERAATRDEIRRDAFEEAAKEPRAYAEQLEKGGWGNRFPDELCAIFNASTNMAHRIRALAATPANDKGAPK